jgi:hypothetical protein
MKKFIYLLLSAALIVTCAGITFGSDVSSHSVSFDFQQINEITVTGSPSLTVSSAEAGQEPTGVTNSTSSCAITTNGTNKKITASIDSAMPAHVTLKVNVAAPSGSGTSQGDVILTTSAADVVTGISTEADSNMSITYKLDATVLAGVLSTDSVTVTFTLSD